VWSISGKVTHLTPALSFQEREPVVLGEVRSRFAKAVFRDDGNAAP
jgi:hypothetical protein